MVYGVEVFRQVYFRYIGVSFVDVLFHFTHGLLSAPFRTVAVASVRKQRLEDGLKLLGDSLLNHPVNAVGMPSFRSPLPSGLGIDFRRTGLGLKLSSRILSRSSPCVPSTTAMPHRRSSRRFQACRDCF